MTSTGPPLKVLVVDNNRLNADTLTTIFHCNNFCAIAAYSAEQALQTAGYFAPDLLIADVMLGGMNGVELACIFAQAWPSCRVLLISGHGDAGQLLEGAESLGLTFPLLAKPLHPDELFRVIAQA